MDDGILKGEGIISAVGDSNGKLDAVDLKSEDSEGLEECVENLCRIGLVRQENNSLYLTKSGKGVYQQLQKRESQKSYAG